MTKVTSFATNDATEKILNEIPWGKRSQFVNECILAKCEAASKKSENTKGSESSTDLKEKSGSSLNSQKPSDEAEATTQENSKPSAPTTPRITALIKSLSRSEEKP